MPLSRNGNAAFLWGISSGGGVGVAMETFPAVIHQSLFGQDGSRQQACRRHQRGLGKLQAGFVFKK